MAVLWCWTGFSMLASIFVFMCLANKETTFRNFHWTNPSRTAASYVTFDRLNELIVVLSSEKRRFVEYTTSEPKNKRTGSYPVMLLLYTKDGRFVRSIRLHTECVLRSRNITVTKEGHVAMCVLYLNNRQGVLVV